MLGLGTAVLDLLPQASGSKVDLAAAPKGGHGSEERVSSVAKYLKARGVTGVGIADIAKPDAEAALSASVEPHMCCPTCGHRAKPSFLR